MNYGTKLFEDVNSQYLHTDLIYVNTDILKEFNIDELEWIELFNKYNLDHNRVYKTTKSMFTKMYYIGDYVASEVIPSISHLDDDFFGLGKVVEREKIFKEMFESEQYSLCFHPEYNDMALYYLITKFNEIKKEKLYDTFIDCYQSISYGFNNIPKEIYKEAFKYAPSKKDILKKLKEDFPYKEFCLKDEINIYRGQGSKSINIQESLSWTMNYDVAKRFRDFNEGIIYKGKVKIEDIIDYLQGGEAEVLVEYNKILCLQKE